MIPHAWPIQRLWNWDREGLQLHGGGGTGLIGTTAATTAITIGRAGILTTFPGDVRVEGVTTLVGGETFEGLVTVTSSTGAGAAGALGPQEIVIQSTQAATAGAPIRSPGYIDWQGRFWDGAASVSANFGRFGAVVDTQAAGVPSTYRMVWTNTAGAIQWSASEVGNTAQAGTGSFVAGAAIVSGTALTGTGAMGLTSAGAGSVTLASAAGTLFTGTSAGAVTVDPLTTLTLELTDNTASALSIAEGARSYFNVGTLDVGATVDLATAALSIVTTIGSITGAASVSLRAGTGNAELGANATDHTTLIGSTTGVSAGSLRAGTGAMTFVQAGATRLQFAGTTGAASFESPDNVVGAFVVAEGARDYVRIGTLDAGATMAFGNATTNPTLQVLGSGQITLTGNVDATGGVDVTGAALTAASGFTLSAGAFSSTGTTFAVTTTGAQTFTLPDNTASALTVVEGANNYLRISTLDAGAVVSLGTAALPTAMTIGSTNTSSTWTAQSGTGAMTFTAGGIWDANVTGVATLDGSTLLLQNTSLGNVGIQSLAVPLSALVVGGAGGVNAGLEVSVSTSMTMQAYNRNTAAYAVLNLDGSSVVLRPSGVAGLTVAAAGLTYAGAIVDVNATGAVTIDASAANAITIGGEANTGAIGIGTGAAARTVTVGSTNTTSTTAIACGTGGLTLGTSANAHTTTVGSTSSTSALTLQSGSGLLTLTANGTAGTALTASTGAGAANVAGGDYSWTGGIGGATADGTAAGRGGQWAATMGTGGAAGAGVGAAGAGGVVSWTAGTGGAATATGVAGLGGAATYAAGTGGVGSGIIPGGNGGVLTLRSGVAGASGGAGAGLDGAISLETGATARLAITGAGSFTLTSLAWDLNATGAVTLDSTGSTIGIGTGADNFAVNIGTAGTRTCTFGSASATSATTLNSGTGAFTIAALGTFALSTTAGTLTQSTLAVPGANVAWTVTAGTHTGLATAGTFTGTLLASSATWTLADAATVTDGQSVRFNAPTFAGLLGGGTETVTNPATIYIPAAPTNGGNITFTNPAAALRLGGALRMEARVLGAQGADVASANDLTLGLDGNCFEITGTTQVNAITTANWQNGSLVTLVFASTPTVKHNTAGGAGTAVLLLAAGADFAATAGDTLTLILSEQGGTQAWREVARTAIA